MVAGVFGLLQCCSLFPDRTCIGHQPWGSGLKARTDSKNENPAELGYGDRATQICVWQNPSHRAAESPAGFERTYFSDCSCFLAPPLGFFFEGKSFKSFAGLVLVALGAALEGDAFFMD